MAKDLAFIRIVDGGAPVKKLVFRLKYSVVDILGIIGKMDGTV